MAGWKYLVTQIDLKDESADDPEDAIQIALDYASAGGWEVVCLLASPLDSSKIFLIVKRLA